MNQKKTFLIFIVILIAILPIIAASCSENSAPSKSSNNGENSNAAEDNDPALLADPKEKYNPNFAPVDMQGYVFIFGTRDNAGVYHGGVAAHTRDLYAEAENGELINDAVFRRNMTIEEKYNCKIEMEDFPEDDEARANKVVERCVKAGDKSFDLLMTHMHLGTNTAVMGCFYDIAKFPNIDLSKPYWNEGATEGYSINYRLYIGLSDLSFSTNENLYCMFFNKELTNNYNVENPYALVKNNKWTFDKFNEIIRMGYVDINGDGKQDEWDQYGYISTAAVNFLWSGGSHVMAKDEYDIPYLDFLNQRTIDIYEKTYSIVNNEYTYSKETNWHTGNTIGQFRNSGGVFYGNQLCRVNELRDTAFDFGIVPYPKYDEAQERYYSYVDGHASMMAIPLNLPNPEWTGLIIEELSYLSYKDVLPPYYDVVLNVKLVRDEESVKTLEILFDSKVFDPSYVLGGDFWVMWNDNIASKKTEIVSTYEKKYPASLAAIQKKIDALLELP